MNNLIITHPGSVHFDDFFAISLVLAINDELGLKNLLPFTNPIEDWFLKQFEKNPGEILPLMRAFGQSVIKDARTLSSQFEFWATAERSIVKDKTILIGRTNDSTGVQRYSSRLVPPADISITYDGRGKGWRLARLNDATGVDFLKLESDKRIKFAHKTGFIAKTKQRIPINEVIELVEKAIAD